MTNSARAIKWRMQFEDREQMIQFEATISSSINEVTVQSACVGICFMQYLDIALGFVLIRTEG